MITHNGPLQWLSHMEQTNPHLTQWYLTLQHYWFSVKYRKGWLHANADFFSQQTVNAYLDEKATLERRQVSSLKDSHPHPSRGPWRP